MFDLWEMAKAVSYVPLPKAGYTLIVSRISTCLHTISWTTSWDCEPITIHFSQYHRFCSSLILRETWRETFPISSLWRFVKIPTVWLEQRNARWEKWLARWFTKCHLYTYRFSHFANIFSHKCIAGLRASKVSAGSSECSTIIVILF